MGPGATSKRAKRAKKRRLARSVRAVGGVPAKREDTKRSISEAPKSTSSSRGRPSDAAKAASLPAANSSALARGALLGPARVTTRRAKAATSGGTERGAQRPITSAVDGPLIGLYVYSTLGPWWGMASAKLCHGPERAPAA